VAPRTPSWWLAKAVHAAARIVGDCLALADAGTTPQATFEGLREARDSLARAGAALVAAVPTDDE
jgi:hypothetical protein